MFVFLLLIVISHKHVLCFRQKKLPSIKPVRSVHIDLSKVRKKAKVWNSYNQITYLAQDTIWESNKNTRKYQTQESQEASPFPAGDPKATRTDNKVYHETQITKRIHKQVSCHTAVSVPCSLVVTCCENANLLALLYMVFSCVCHFPIWFPGSSVVFD